jgi:hypothetical protein
MILNNHLKEKNLILTHKYENIHDFLNESDQNYFYSDYLNVVIIKNYTNKYMTYF